MRGRWWCKLRLRSDLLDLARDDTSVAGIVGWVPLDAPDSVELIDELAREPKLKGVRPMLQDLPDDRWIESPALAPAIRALIKSDLAFDALIFSRHVPSLKVFAARFPELRIVVDHGAKPQIKDGHAAWQSWADGIAELAALPQGLVCKSEAAPGWSVATLKPYVDHLLDHFGPERLMWGSDWPVLNLNGDYSHWFDAARQLTAHLDASAQQWSSVVPRASFIGCKSWAKRMKNERGIPRIPQLQLQRKQRMVKKLATKPRDIP